MRIAFCYPPIPSPYGQPLLSQNRQFQWFSHATTIYPVVPASAATCMAKRGHEVLWHDGIARHLSPELYLEQLLAWHPDALFLETKTPVFNATAAWIKAFLAKQPNVRIYLAGDHVTACPELCAKLLPEVTLLRGGHYDFALLSAIEGREIPVDLATLPHIDRELTCWRDYAYHNGNYARTPGAYIMAGRDCWHGKCTFCSWTTLYPNYRVRPVEDVLDEIGELIALGVREIMDDTGCFPVGDWLKSFCNGMIARGYARKIHFDCNMRFGCLTSEMYQLMHQAGFRLVLFGVESANQSTLDKLNKHLTVEHVRTGAEAASKAGLAVHITLMFGYPWETRADAQRTIDLARELIAKGAASTLQATWLVPYPGTPLYRELQASGGLLTERWEDYDMRHPVMRSPMSEAEIKACVAACYRAFFQPRALIRRGIEFLCHPMRDGAMLLRGARAILGHLTDFKHSTEA